MILNNEERLNNVSNVAIYIRKSRGEELEEDLAKHTFALKEVCEQKGWKYVEYREIESGSSIEARPEVRKLMKDVESNIYDAVLVYSFDRIGRGGSGDQELIFRKLRNSETYYIVASPSLKAYDFNDPGDAQEADIQGFVAKFEYTKTVERLVNGKKNGLKLGNWVYGRPPFGYDYDRKSKGLIINQEQAKVLWFIRDLLFEGYILSNAMWEVNKRKWPSASGMRWNHVGTVKKMMKNPVYQGHLVGNKSEGLSGKNLKKYPNSKPHKAKPEEEWIVVKNCHEAIFSEEDAVRLNQILETKKSKRTTYKTRAFNGLIYCAECGGKLRQQESWITRCKCGTMGGHEDLVKAAVIETVKALKTKLEAESSDKIQQQKELKLQSRITELKKEFEKHDRAIDRISIAYDDGDYDRDTFRKKTSERQMMQRDIESELNDLNKKMSVFNAQQKMETLTQIDIFLNDIEKSTSEPSLNQLYKQMIKEILWRKPDKKSLSVTVNFL